MKKSLLLFFGVGLLLAFFPWLFSYRGDIFGHYVSISAVGDVLGILVALFGVWMLGSRSMREKVVGIGKTLDSLPAVRQTQLMFAGTSLYAAGSISHKFRAHYLIGTHAFDLGFFSNICWNTSVGRWFFSSELERNFMGVHVNWILWPLSFFYRFFPGAEVLLAAQTLMAATAAAVLWAIAKKEFGSFSAGAVMAALFCASPFIGHSVSNDFHPDLWLLPCLMAALWAWQARQRSWLLCFSMLALLAKEDVSVVLCGFGVMLSLDREWRLTGVALMTLALAAFAFHTQMMIPRFLEKDESSLLFARYPLLGDDYKQMLHSLFLNPPALFRALAYDPAKYGRFACYFLPVGGAVLLTPSFLIPPIISVMPHILSQASTQLSLADIYSLPSQPFIFVGAVFGMRRILKKLGSSSVSLLVGGAFVIAGVGIFRAPRYFHSESAPRLAAFHELAALVPVEASVAAQQNIQPHFEARRFIQLFPIGNSMPQLQRRVLQNPEFIICDRIGNALPYDGDMLNAQIAGLETAGMYEKIFDKEKFIVFKRSASEPQQWKIY